MQHNKRKLSKGTWTAALALLVTTGLASADVPVNRSAELVLVTGATGRVGQEVIREARARGYRVRAISRDRAAAIERFGTDYDWVEANMLNRDELQVAMRGVDRVISAAGATRPDGLEGPRFVDYEGVINLIDVAIEHDVKQLILTSSIGVTHRFHLLNLTFGDVLIYKSRSEDYLRATNLNYTIVRPGGLRPGPKGREGLSLEQGDKKGGSYVIIPDVAVLMAWLLDNPAARGKTFEVLSNSHAEPLAWQADFSKLRDDP